LIEKPWQGGASRNQIKLSLPKAELAHDLDGVEIADVRGLHQRP